MDQETARYLAEETFWRDFALNQHVRHLPSMLLNSFPKLVPAIVTEIQQDAANHWRKLHAFGIFPGVGIRVIQRHPALVVQVGETEVALDGQTARLISVRAASHDAG